MKARLEPRNQFPPPTTQLSIQQIFEMRIALEEIKTPTKEIATAKSQLDQIILNFTQSLTPKENA